MGARLLVGTARPQDAIPAPRLPWKRLAVAGGFAALAEILELKLRLSWLKSRNWKPNVLTLTKRLKATFVNWEL